MHLVPRSPLRPRVTMGSRIVCGIVLPAAMGLILSLLPGTNGSEGAEASGNVTTVLLAEGDDALAATFQLGNGDAWASIAIHLDDGGSHVFRGRVESDRIRKQATENGKAVWNDVTLPDAAVSFSGLPRFYSRPRLGRYTNEQQDALISRWHELPSASERFITFEAKQDLAGVSLYLDGQYVGRRDSAAKLKGLEASLPPGGLVRDARSFHSYCDGGDFLPLDLKWIAKPGAMKNATVSLPPGLRTVGGVPMLVAGGRASVDVGVVKECKGSWALECDEHLSRTALDGMPETAHFSVPQATYTRAWVLCAVEPSPERDPILTARLTRFATSGRGDAISDTSVVLPRPGEPVFPGVTQVGSVRFEQGGSTIEVPLLLAEVQLEPGKILDLLSMDKDPRASMMQAPYLDFEFLGKLDGVYAQWDRRHKPDKTSTSAVHVFGATLERSPVSLRLESGQPGNIFHNDQRPEWSPVLKATRPCEAVFAWKIRDIGGGTIRESSVPLTFTAVGDEKTVRIPLDMDQLGWYGIDLALHDEHGRELLTHAASCALLGTDTRTAGYDSPYGTWWFAGAHYGAGDKEIAGPMLFKAGLRKTTFGWCDYSEADMAPWKITLNQLGWGLAPKDMADKQNAYDEADAKVRQMRERFPHCRSANIFHESYAHYVPAELLDEQPVEDERAVQDGKLRVEIGEFAARFYRERFPEIELLVGNTSSSASILAALLRHGFDPNFIDAIGVEAVGQTGMPELLWEGSTQGIWLAREVARKFGHDLPVTGCYEFTARTERNLGEQRHAEWIVRDMLLCHAYRFKHINPAILHDAGNAYFNTLWGAGGLCRRNPLLYPKPAYAAVATLTKVLDQVEPPRRVATGSPTVYALEFPRSDGKLVYALWTACGEARLRLDLANGAAPTVVGFYGNPIPTPRPSDGLDVQCGTAPVYVVAPVACQSIEILDRRFAPAPESFQVLDPLSDPALWTLEPADARLAQPTPRGLPIRVPGDFALTRRDDEEKGPCLELKLRREGQVPDIVGESTRLRRLQTLPAPGKPTAVGVWVQGDSGWGKIIFEIEDAAGALWRTDGVWHDWPGDLAICHDGWRFMSYPIDGNTTERNISPGARWTSTSPTKKGSIQFPIQLVGLSIVLNRKALDLTEMKEVPAILRLRDLGIIEDGDVSNR
ncbi:MAG: hypothetical protein KJ000_14220 [Pirellulaceae bacterium]|nr:hypothetical protein [Pirellulaceae bacterium]